MKRSIVSNRKLSSRDAMFNLIIGRLEYNIIEPDKNVSEDGHDKTVSEDGHGWLHVTMANRHEKEKENYPSETSIKYTMELSGDNSDN